MKNILKTFVFIFLLCQPKIFGSEKLYDGNKIDKSSVDPHVTAVYIGPRFPDVEFIKLKLPKRLCGAYYRLIFSFGEIYQCITAELTGFNELNDPEIISAYLIPLNGNSDFCIKGKIDFKGWTDYHTFKIETDIIQKVRIYNNGKFSFIDE
jgi:hypothetical protein